MGTLRAYVELKIQLDAGVFNGHHGPGQGETGAGNKSELYRGYLQWAGWTIGEADSIWSLGSLQERRHRRRADDRQVDRLDGLLHLDPLGPGRAAREGLGAGAGRMVVLRWRRHSAQAHLQAAGRRRLPVL